MRDQLANLNNFEFQGLISFRVYGVVNHMGGVVFYDENRHCRIGEVSMYDLARAQYQRGLNLPAALERVFWSYHDDVSRWEGKLPQIVWC